MPAAWKLSTALTCCCGLLLLLVAPDCASSAASNHIWVVQVDEGGEEVARSIAESHHLEYQGRVPHLRNKFVYQLSSSYRASGNNDDDSSGAGVAARSRRSAVGTARPSYYHVAVHRSLQRHPKVSWVSYQTELSREKRDFVAFDSIGATGRFSRGQKASSGNWVGNRAVSDFSPSELNRHAESVFVDPLWPEQWYLHDTRPTSQHDGNRQQPKLDLHVIPAWRRNLTGRGVVVAIVDDGLERDHPDLVANYDQRASYNYNNDTTDPMPKYLNIEEERHGTRCAGEVAMSANNSYCGVGVAFNARIGGVKILDGGMSDLLEARGLSHAMDYVDVYSASWGPTDDGKSMEAPGPLAMEALQTGVERGRGGKGVVYVWASGNGGAFGDNCNCDGYASSVFTVAVSSASQHLSPPWYTEHCSATLATTFSSGSSAEQRIVSTDLRHKCTTQFTGTSASAPMAAGIVALLLEANPNLTWRDIQHVIVWTAEVAPLRNNPGWQRNAAGHYYHHRFGFGLFNVGAMADLVQPVTWRTVPEKNIVQLGNWRCVNGWTLRRSKSIRCELAVSRSVQRRIKYLEHVQLRVKLSYPERGALAIYINSAAGTRSQLLTRRRHDTAKTGLPRWAFMTVHFWGENPSGRWTVDIQDQSGKGSHSGALEEMELILHGTAAAPDYRIRAGGYRKYNHEYNNEKNMQIAYPEEQQDQQQQPRQQQQQQPTSSVIDRLDRFYHKLFEATSGSHNRMRPEPSYWLQKVAGF